MFEFLGLGGRRKEVMILRPNDRHFMDVRVEETDKSLQTPKIKGITRFFAKKYSGWTNDRNGETRYIGLEGCDYTLEIRGAITHIIGLDEAVKQVMPEADYKNLTEEAKRELGAAKFGIVTEAITPEKREGEGNENQFSETDIKLIGAFGEAAAKAGKALEKTDWIKTLGLVAMGALAYHAAIIMGWIK